MAKQLKLKNGTIILVMEIDFEIQENWDNAKKECEKIGLGWRLPTFDELVEIFNDKDNHNFAEYGFWSYWSNDQYLEKAYVFDGPEGIKGLANKNEKLYFRAVKSID
jgi:hypothetical protein